MIDSYTKKMTKCIYILVLMLSYNVVIGQQKEKSEVLALLTNDAGYTCFIFSLKEQKNDTMVLETEKMLEFNRSGKHVKLIIRSVEYDPIKEKAANDEGYNLVWKRYIQYINATYKIDKKYLIFTPDEVDSYNPQTFKLFYKNNKVDYMQDENNNRYININCPDTNVRITR